jgi:hypothetical protein
VILLFAFAVVPVASHADGISVTLSQSSETGSQGQTLTFQGTVSNLGATAISGISDEITLENTSAMTSDDTAFFTNVPASLGSGGSTGVVDLFNILISATASPGTYTLNFLDVLDSGGGTADAPFTVVVTPQTTATTPEPATFGLMGLGFVAFGASSLLRRSRNREAMS